MKIIPKVVLLVSLSVAIVMAGLNYVSIRQTEKVIHREIERLLHCGLDFSARAVLDRTQAVMRTAEIIARDPAISRALFLQVSTGINRNLNEMISIYPFFKYVMIIEPNGDVFAINTTGDRGRKTAGEEILGLNFRENPRFAEPAEKGTTAGSPGPDPYLALLGIKGGMSQWFITPVLKGETPIGWVVVAYDWEAEMRKLVGDVTQQLTMTGQPVIETVLADENGTIVVGTGPIRGKIGPSPNVLLHEKLLSFGTMHLRLVIANDTTEAMRPITTLKGFFLTGGGVAAILLAAILYFVLHRTLLARLRLIQTGAQAFREGDLSYRLPYLGHDELGELSKIFNEMGLSLQTVLADLKVEKEQLALTLENTPVGVITCDTHGRFLTANPAFCEMLGYSVSELQRLSIQDVTHTDDVPESLLAVQDLLQGNTQTLLLEKRYIRKDSSVRIGIVRSGVIRDDQGHPITLVGAVEDVTELKKAQKAQRESEERFRNLFEQSPLGIAIVGLDYRWVAVNATLCEMIGYSADELSKLTFVDITYPGDIEKDVEHAERLARGEIPSYRTEKRYIRKNGQVLWIHLTVSIIRDDREEAHYFLSMVEDISDRKHAEGALSESEERYRSLVENIALAINMIDSDHNIVMANATTGKWLKKPVSELSGKKCYREFHHREAVCAYCPGVRAMITGQTSEAQNEAVNDDGSSRTVLIRAFPTWGQDGLTTGFIEVVEDITERKRVAQALKESEERFRAVFENNHVVMLIIDPETGGIEDASPGACAFYGYEREELKSKKISDINILSPRQIFERMEMAKSRQKKYFDFQHRLANGEIRDVEVCTGPIVAAGRSLLFSVINDVTDRKKAEEALRQSEAHNRLLVEESPVGIGVLLGRELAYANPALLRTFGFQSLREIVGRPVAEFIDKSDRERLFRSQQDRLAGKATPPYHEALGVRKNGERFDMALWPRAIDYLGKRAILFFLIDTSESRALRSQLVQAQKMEAVGTLAGGIAHDFNNILQVALGYSELILSEEDLPTRCRDDLAKINQAAQNGADLVRRLLLFSRKSETKPLVLNLNRRIEQLQKMLSRVIPKMIGIELILADDIAAISADPTQVEQVLMNLAINAKDAMPEGGKLVIETSNVFLDDGYAKSHLDVAPGRYVLLTVTDTGLGMGKETLEHIFEPFFTTKETGRGTGLGLAMVHGIVQQHGGHIWCYSEPGKGTTFKIYFPAIVSDEELKETTVWVLPRGGSETILLVDDEELICELGSRILTKAGYTVITASNGKEALESYIAQPEKIALVILDLIMPEMGGKRCLEGLLNLDPSVKVVIASGYSADGPTKEALNVGAKGFVNKPYDVRQVLEVVRSVLDEE